MAWLSRLLVGGLTLLYPLAVYWALSRDGLTLAVVALAPIALLHLIRGLRGAKSGWIWFGLCLVLAAWTLVAGSPMGVKAYPVLVNAGLLLAFGWTLCRPPSMIERLARLSEPELPDSAILYTRNVTWIWVGFFALNGSIAAATLWADDRIWALYNGLVSYLLMGGLFLGEWLFRQYHRRQRNE